MVQNKSVWICYLGNPHLDSRVNNLYSSLIECGYSVRITAFDLYTKNFKKVTGDISIFPLERKKPTSKFYFNFARTLCSQLRNGRADIYFAEDIYTLPFAAYYARKNKGKLIYNSRELYAFLGGHAKKKHLSFLLRTIEKIFIKKCNLVLTTGELDTQFLEKMYSISNVITVRNIPAYSRPDNSIDLRKELNIPEDKVILLYQGVLLKGRGIQKVFKALQRIDNAVFLILGEGEQRAGFGKLAEELGVADKVIYYGMVPHSKLVNYSAAADAGIALIENISLSYYYALPNKLFEYIMAGVPVISSTLPQMKKIVDDYGVGITANAENEEDVYIAVRDFIADREAMKVYKENCLNAAKELNWQMEFEKLKIHL